MLADHFLEASAWNGSFVATESTLHQLSPYIGKLKSGMAAELITKLTPVGGKVFDPFAGSGTVPLEAWIAGRHSIANDLSPYCRLLLNAKLGTIPTECDVLRRLEDYEKLVADSLERSIDYEVPDSIRRFFHPKTLNEVLVWVRVLRAKRDWFLLACLMGILHHQRPGFLSFPASHAVPYLRTTLFPQDEFPELYAYRNVYERLRRKALRAIRRVPHLDENLTRSVHTRDSARFCPSAIDAVITSPPYMRRLSYGRDNRLRLWFLGAMDADLIDRDVSPGLDAFLLLMKRCIRLWGRSLVLGGKCAVVLGDEPVNRFGTTLPQLVSQLFEQDETRFVLCDWVSETIPLERRVRREAAGSKSETILVWEKVELP